MPDDLFELHRAFNEAELHADTDLLHTLLAEDFLSIGERGFQLDKHQWIGRHDEFGYLDLETTEVDVRHYDRAAIVRYVQRGRASWRGDVFALAVRVSQMWIERPEGWRLAGIQFSTLDAG